MAEGKGGWALTFFKKELKVLGAAEGGRKGFVFFFHSTVPPPFCFAACMLRVCVLARVANGIVVVVVEGGKCCFAREEKSMAVKLGSSSSFSSSSSKGGKNSGRLLEMETSR